MQSLVTATGLEQWFLNLSVHKNLEVLLKHTSQNSNPDFRIYQFWGGGGAGLRIYISNKFPVWFPHFENHCHRPAQRKSGVE